MQTAVSSTPKLNAPMASSGYRRHLRILHTVSSLQFGGMEQFVVRLATVQARHGHKVAILALRGGPLKEIAREAGLHVSVLTHSSSAVRFLAGVAKAAFTRSDIIHAHNPTSLHYASGAKLMCGAKLVLTDHGQCAGVARPPGNWEVRQVDGLVSVSEDAGIRHKAMFRHNTMFRHSSKYIVIRNGLEFAGPNRSREEVLRELNLPSGPTLIVVARVEPVKDQETLLRAVSILQQRNIDANLLVVGDGSERQRLEMLLPQLGLRQERVRFLGFRTDIPDLLNAADIFVLSSLQEGLPLALLEAMGQGLPVVATSVGGVPELISHRRNGILCPPQSPVVLAEALAEIIQDADLCSRIGRAGALRVKADFSFEHMAQQYEELYRNLVDA